MVTRQQIIDEAKAIGFNVHPDEEIQPGDSYVARRNTGLKLLTCESVNHADGWINAEPINGVMQYPYDTNECVKVSLVT